MLQTAPNRSLRPASLLRVRFAAPATDAAAQAWALFDEGGRQLRAGRDAPAAWPQAGAAEAIVAGASVRLAVVTLPPLAPARVRAAAAFAVEDQLAGAPGTQQLAAARQTADGRVRVVIVDRERLAAIVALPSIVPGLPPWRRVVAEPELVPADSDWHWCADDDQGGDAFLRLDDGASIPVPPPARGPLPLEFVRLAERRGPAPPAVAVHADIDDTSLAAWSDATRIRFYAQPPWQWAACPPAAFAAATELRQGEFAPVSAPAAGRTRRLWQPAIAIAVAALGLHVVATLVDWAWLRIDAAQTAAAWRTLAAGAGIDPGPGGDARGALTRRFAELRHGSGLAAPDDPLPTLGRAAPALSHLPPGTLKSASFSGGAWTVDLGNLDADALRAFDAGMKAAGVPALIARTGGSVRARFGGAS